MATTNNKGLNIALWSGQIVLAAMFLMAGTLKTFSPIEDLVAKGMSWAGDIPALARFIGISELLGGIGLILPALLRIKPVLTAWAATGLAVIMILGVGVHIFSGDTLAHTLTPAFLGLIAIFVAWGRFTKVPIAAK